jgi:hypothetical protein
MHSDNQQSKEVIGDCVVHISSIIASTPLHVAEGTGRTSSTEDNNSWLKTPAT